MIRILQGLLLVSVGLYLITFIVGLFFSDQIIFQPQVAGYRDSETVLKLTSADGAKISAIYLANRDAAFTVLFSHGNAEDIGDDRGLLEGLTQQGLRCSLSIIRDTEPVKASRQNDTHMKTKTLPTIS